MSDRKSRRDKPRRKNAFLDILNGLLTLVVLGLVIAGGVLIYGASQFYGDSKIAEERSFVVESGSSLGLTAARLESQGLISNQYIFQLGGRALKKQGQLKPGEFRIPAGSSMEDILRELTEGTPIPYAVTVPEGFTVWQAVQRINDDTNLTGDKITALPPEGSLLPDTYNYLPNATRQSVLETMQTAMATEVAKVWAARNPDLPIETPEQLVTLASIVEKETGVASERPQVAAVFVNRIRTNMRLQSDPTIIYGITKGESVLGRGLLRSEIEQSTPYNTYQIDGLPPTPIANPGIDALRAVANPDTHKYLYFVAAGAVPSDGHVFAETYAEHRVNVAKYRQIERAAAQRVETDAEATREALEAEQADEAPPATPATQP